MVTNPTIELEVRRGQEPVRVGSVVSVAVVQVVISVEDVEVGMLDLLRFDSTRPVSAAEMNKLCSGRLWNLHEIMASAFCERGQIEDIFEDGPFAVIEHVSITERYRRAGIASKVLSAVASSDLAGVKWLYIHIDDTPDGQQIEDWLKSIFRCFEASPGSYNYFRCSDLSSRAIHA